MFSGDLIPCTLTLPFISPARPALAKVTAQPMTARVLVAVFHEFIVCLSFSNVRAINQLAARLPKRRSQSRPQTHLAGRKACCPRLDRYTAVSRYVGTHR